MTQNKNYNFWEDAMRRNRRKNTHNVDAASKLKNNEGFTILEVVFSMGIFAIGILGVCALQTAAIKTLSSANYITEGTTNAQDKVEELMELSFSDSGLSVGDHTDSDPPSGYAITWNVAANTTTSKSVTVTSAWQNVNGMTVNSQLNFLKYNW